MSIVKKKVYKNVIDYEFSPSSKMIALINEENDEKRIYLININKEVGAIIWKGSNIIKKIIFDNSGSQIAFSIDTTLWYYNLNSAEKPKELKIPVKKEFIGLSNPFPEFFSKKDDLLFFKTEEQEPKLNSSKVSNYYSYLDGNFDMSAEPSLSNYLCCYNLINGSITRVEQENERMIRISNDEKKILVSNRQGSSADYYWNRKSSLRDYILYTESTEKKKLKQTLA